MFLLFQKMLQQNNFFPSSSNVKKLLHFSVYSPCFHCILCFIQCAVCSFILMVFSTLASSKFTTFMRCHSLQQTHTHTTVVSTYFNIYLTILPRLTILTSIYFSFLAFITSVFHSSRCRHDVLKVLLA